MDIQTHSIILEVRNLTKYYENKLVVKNASFTVKKGQVVGLLGPNGAGKTTAFYMTMGLIKPTTGAVIFNGIDVSKLPVHKRAQLGMGYLAQEPSIFGNLTVEENILCILEKFSLSKSERFSRLHKLLGELDLHALSKKKAATLSGGERRRLEITRSLITKPKILLLDEPFANVDPKTIKDVKNVIKFLTAKGISILITDHNAREVSSIVDHCYLLQGGTVTHSGKINEIISCENARSAYFGEDFEL